VSDLIERATLDAENQKLFNALIPHVMKAVVATTDIICDDDSGTDTISVEELHSVATEQLSSAAETYAIEEVLEDGDMIKSILKFIGFERSADCYESIVKDKDSPAIRSIIIDMVTMLFSLIGDNILNRTVQSLIADEQTGASLETTAD